MGVQLEYAVTSIRQWTHCLRLTFCTTSSKSENSVGFPKGIFFYYGPQTNLCEKSSNTSYVEKLTQISTFLLKLLDNIVYVSVCDLSKSVNAGSVLQ